MYTVKKMLAIFPSPVPGCHLPNSPWSGIIKLFPTRESLVSYIPAGDGKMADVFYSVGAFFWSCRCCISYDEVMKSLHKKTMKSKLSLSNFSKATNIAKLIGDVLSFFDHYTRSIRFAYLRCEHSQSQ